MSGPSTPSSSLPPSYSSPTPINIDDLSNPYPQPYPRVPSSTIISIPSSSLSNNNDDDEERLNKFYNDNDNEDDEVLANKPDVHLSLPLHMRRASHEQELERTLSNSSSVATAEAGESTSLLSHDDDNNNNTETEGKWYNGPLAITAIKLGILFILFSGVLVATFYLGIPKMDEEDRGVLRLPRSFADLQALNNLFQKYKHRNPYRILACGVVSYLFVQTFSLPGSMYISILFGAAYGIIYGLLLSCLCESVGSVFCYTLSSLLAPPLLTLPFYRARVETWRIKIMGDPKKGKQVTWDGVFAFLIVLRIAPFPPHWVANFVAPHLGIGVFLFWSSCFIGIAPVSVIHVTIGSSLDSMTSAADFHILSLRNVLGLCAVVVAVLIPVGLKRVFRNDLGDLGEAEEVLVETGVRERDIQVPAVGDGQARRYHAIDSGVVLAAPSRGDGLDMRSKTIKGKGRALEIIPDLDEEEDEDDLARLLNEAIVGEGEEEGESSSSSLAISTPTNWPQGQGRVRFEPQEGDYEIFDSKGRFQRIQLSKEIGKPHRPNIQNDYGTIQSQSLDLTTFGMGINTTNAGPGEREMSAGGWWPFARIGVA